MNPASLILFSIVAILVLLFCRWMNRAVAAEQLQAGQSVQPTSDRRWTGRSVAFKMAYGAASMAALVLVSYLGSRRQAARGGAAPPVSMILLGLIASVLVGALFGFLIALRDFVLDRTERDERIHPLLRAYYGWGLGSLFLWLATGFVTAIAAIIDYYLLLRYVAGPPR